MAETHTFTMNDTLPTLYIPYPECGHCGTDVTIEDGCAWCDTCLIQWDDICDGAQAKPDEGRDGTEVPCEIVTGTQDMPFIRNGKHYVPGPPLACILPSGHEGRHLCPHDVQVTEMEN